MSRDPRFDGRFIVAVLTTGIYCRPVCPAKTPASDNVRYFLSAAAAQDAGYRPCLRCRPETAAPLPEWSIGSRTVIQGLRLIGAGVVDREGAAGLARRLGLSQRHLNRLFQRELGATPKSLALTRRRQLAKRLLDETSLPLAQIALQAGYGSVRRFNDDLRQVYERSPRQLRGSAPRPSDIELRLPVRQPYHVDWVFDFLARRALSGLEEVQGRCYRRRIRDRAGTLHWVQVRWDGDALRLQIPRSADVELAEVLPRVRRVFDLDADSAVVDAHLAGDPLLGDVLAAGPGLRVPGAWDGFETAVRAVLGQQVSVDRATRLAHLLMQRYGGGLFPEPAALAAANPAEIGMPGRRGAAISALAAAVADGDLELHDGVDAQDLRAALVAVPGIGPWTAGYVSMRVARDPDAFVDSDWVVLKVLGATPARARALAEAWRPWRAYAVMYLWRLAGLRRAETAPAASLPQSQPEE
ncbi:MAG: AlkA N-terminal domain-containing protein [Pseudomonadales bacterium]